MGINGVAWIIIDHNKKRAEDMKDMSRPIIVSTKCVHEKIKNIKNDISENKVIECILSIKMLGMAYCTTPLFILLCVRPMVFLLNRLPILSYLDVNESSQYDIKIVLNPEQISTNKLISG